MANPQNADHGRGDLPAETTLDRVDLLVSALVDEHISDAELQELESLLEESLEARQRYMQGMQLHANLMQHYQPVDATDLTKKSPVLGFLGPDESGIHFPPARPADQS